MHIREGEDDGIDLICKAEIRHTEVENKLLGTEMGRGDGMNWEIGIDTTDTLYKIDGLP